MKLPRFQRSLKVAFADTDASGWVHFPNVFRYVEMAEHEYLISLGMEVFDLRSGGWPRVKVGCEYLKPMRAGEDVEVVLWIEKVGGSSVSWLFEIKNSEGECMAKGEMKTVRVGRDRHAKAFDARERAILEG